VSSGRDVEVLRQVLDGFNRHDLDAIMSCFADDCVFEAPRGPDPWGRRFGIPIADWGRVVR
jgi:ketosteroid isomerase-like protein